MKGGGVMPLPNHRIIPPGFQERWRPVIAGTMRSVVQVRRPDTLGTRDAVACRTSFTDTLVYDGPARVQSRGGGATARGPGGSSVGVANRIVTVGSYLVAVPTDSAETKVNDLVEIVTCPDSPALEGLTLVVTGVSYADVAWQRNLACDLQEPTARG